MKVLKKPRIEWIVDPFRSRRFSHLVHHMRDNLEFLCTRISSPGALFDSHAIIFDSLIRKISVRPDMLADALQVLESEGKVYKEPVSLKSVIICDWVPPVMEKRAKNWLMNVSWRWRYRPGLGYRNRQIRWNGTEWAFDSGKPSGWNGIAWFPDEEEEECTYRRDCTCSRCVPPIVEPKSVNLCPRCGAELPWKGRHSRVRKGHNKYKCDMYLVESVVKA